jgi:hypothetical protein
MTAEAGWTVLAQDHPGQPSHIVADLTDAGTAARLAEEMEAEDTLNGRNGRYRAAPVGDPNDAPAVPEPPDEWSCPDYYDALTVMPERFVPPPAPPFAVLHIDPADPLGLTAVLPPGVAHAVRTGLHTGTLPTYQPGAVPNGQAGQPAVTG